MKRAVIIFFTFVFMFCSLSVSAQRQTAGRPSIDAQVLFGLKGMEGQKFSVGGGTITWNNYQYIGHTSLGLDIFTQPCTVVQDQILDTKDGSVIIPYSEHTFRSYDALAGGGYFFRLLASRSRTVVLSAGVSGFVGIRYCEEVSTIVKELNYNGVVPVPVYYPKIGFLLLFAPEVQFEVFPFRNASLFITARPRIDAVNILHGSPGWFVFSCGAGFKYYI